MLILVISTFDMTKNFSNLNNQINGKKITKYSTTNN